MVAELLCLGVEPDLTGLDGLAMSRGRARRICAKGLAEKSEIGENVGRGNVIASVRTRVPVDYFKKQPRKREWGPKWADAVGADPNVARTLAPVPEETPSPPPAPLPPPSHPTTPSPAEYSPGGTHEFGPSYTPFVASNLSEPLPPLPPGAALRLEMAGTRDALHAHLYSHLDVMEAAVAQTLLAAAADAPSPRTATLDLVPISPWSTLDGSCVPRKSMRLPGGGRALPVFVALKHALRGVGRECGRVERREGDGGGARVAEASEERRRR